MSMPEPQRRKRILYMLGGVVLVFMLLAVRVFTLQVIQAAELQNKASSQWVTNKPVAALRGSITDRNGEILAQSGTADTVLLRPKQIASSKLNTEENPNYAAELVADKLASILGMDRENIYQKATDTSKSEIWLARQIDKDVSNQIREAIDTYNLPGVAFTVDAKRYYPKGDFLTQVLGFTSVDGTGLEGVEAYYDKYLTGEQGKISTESDSRGNSIAFGSEYYIPAVDGYTVELTIDYSIQSFLEKSAMDAAERYNAKSVQAVAMDPNTGEILGLTVKPSYDLNNVPRDDADTLTSMSRNRIVADNYEPGSVFKIFTTAMSLEEGIATPSRTFVCGGGRTINGERIKCWSQAHTGTLTLLNALEKSCNPCFMDLALELGVDKFYSYLDKFGFGKITGVDIAGEAGGILMSQDRVRDADLAREGFGQSVSVTPIQMITSVSAMINGGYLYTPRIANRILTKDGEVVKDFASEPKAQIISEETSATLRDLLEGVGKSGTKVAYVPGYRVGTKSGTAQKYDENGKIMENKHISSFMGFAPANDPKIVVLFIVDEPDAYVDFGSVIAGPYVKDVIEQAMQYMKVEPQYNEEEQQSLGQKATVPDLKDLTQEEAQKKLRSAGLTGEFSGEGIVVDQMPAMGTVVPKNTEVMVYLRTEEQIASKEMVQVPYLIGMTLSEATAALEEKGLTIGAQGASGKVTWQFPKADTEVEKGSQIRVELKE